MNQDESKSIGTGSEQPLAELLTQTMRTGLPLESGLRALAEQTQNRSTRRTLIELSDKLEAGTPLYEAINTTKSGLPHQMAVLVEAGIESGRLDAVMQYCIGQNLRSSSIRQQVLLSLSYPIFLTWLSTLICFSILILIAPFFAQILSDFGTELPGLTLFIVTMSDALKPLGWMPWLAISLGGIGFWVLLVMLCSTTWGQRRLTSIPLIGRGFRYAALTDFCHLLAILTEAELTFPRALSFAGNASDDRWLDLKCALIEKEIEQGSKPSEAARFAGLPNSMSQAFRQSNSGKSFVNALRGLAEIYSAQSRVSMQVTNIFFARMAVIFVVCFVGLTAIAMFMPLIKLLNDLS